MTDGNKIINEFIQFLPVFDGGEPPFRDGGITVICSGDLTADCADGIGISTKIIRRGIYNSRNFESEFDVT